MQGLIRASVFLMATGDTRVKPVYDRSGYLCGLSLIGLEKCEMPV